MTFGWKALRAEFPESRGCNEPSPGAAERIGVRRLPRLVRRRRLAALVLARFGAGLQTWRRPSSINR